MKKTNFKKQISILLIGIMSIVILNTNVMAAENTNGFSDLTGTISGNSSGNNTNGGNSSNNNTNSNNTNTNKSNTNTNSNSNSAKNNTNASKNSSVYNNTNLPKTGIEDSIPVALLVVVFGISAVYAYKKITDYKNI